MTSLAQALDQIQLNADEEPGDLLTAAVKDRSGHCHDEDGRWTGCDTPDLPGEVVLKAADGATVHADVGADGTVTVHIGDGPAARLSHRDIDHLIAGLQRLRDEHEPEEVASVGAGGFVDVALLSDHTVTVDNGADEPLVFSVEEAGGLIEGLTYLATVALPGDGDRDLVEVDGFSVSGPDQNDVSVDLYSDGSYVLTVGGVEQELGTDPQVVIDALRAMVEADSQRPLAASPARQVVLSVRLPAPPAGTFHLPGKHDQKTHGRRYPKGPGGRGRLLPSGDTPAGLPPNPSRRVEGRDVTADRGVLDAALAASGRYQDLADPMMGGLAEQLGFNGRPERVKEDRIRQEIAAGGIEVWRGVEPKVEFGDVVKSAQSMVDDYRTGPMWYGHGLGANGLYATTSTRTADRYATGGGAVLRMVLRADARTIGHIDLRRQHDLWWQTDPDRSPMLQDPGRFAMALGYDAIVAPLASVPGETYVVVLNRTSTLVDD